MAKRKDVKLPTGDWISVCRAMEWLNQFYSEYQTGSDSIDITDPEFVSACNRWRRLHSGVVDEAVCEPSNVKQFLVDERRAGRLVALRSGPITEQSRMQYAPSDKNRRLERLKQAWSAANKTERSDFVEYIESEAATAVAATAATVS